MLEQAFERGNLGKRVGFLLAFQLNNLRGGAVYELFVRQFLPDSSKETLQTLDFRFGSLTFCLQINVSFHLNTVFLGADKETYAGISRMLNVKDLLHECHFADNRSQSLAMGDVVIANNLKSHEGFGRNVLLLAGTTYACDDTLCLFEALKHVFVLLGKR